MCEFISFIVADNGNGLDIFVGGTLNSHNDIPISGYECEWTDDDHGESLSVRVRPDASENHVDTIKNFILGRYPNWKRFAKWAIGQIDCWDDERAEFDFANTPIFDGLLPKNLYVAGDLDLSHCSRMTALPDGLRVGRDLWIKRSAISWLPKDLFVGGFFSASYCSIQNIPRGLTVGGSANFEHTTFTMSKGIPDDIYVGESLNISHTNIDRLPNYRVMANALFVRGIDFLSIPAGVRVGFDSEDEQKAEFNRRAANVNVPNRYY